jgi:hypothetical protein
MNMKFMRILLSMFAIIPLLATSQTTTFNYLSTNLGTSCKVFSPSVNISSIPHVALAGGVGWSSTDGLQLSTIPSGPSAGGTAFTINYNFTSGYNYTIAVTAMEILHCISKLPLYQT